MDRLRVRMLQSQDQLVKDNEYFLPEDIARKLAAAGVAEILAVPGASPTMEPSETKPAAPPELKAHEAEPEPEPEAEPPEEEEEPEPAPEPRKPEPKPEPKPVPKPEPKPVPRPPARKLPLKKHAR